MNRRQAARIQGQLAARFRGAPVYVTPTPDGAHIVIEHPVGYHVRLTTGDSPGPILRAMIGRDLRSVDGEIPPDRSGPDSGDLAGPLLLTRLGARGANQESRI